MTSYFEAEADDDEDLDDFEEYGEPVGGRVSFDVPDYADWFDQLTL